MIDFKYNGWTTIRGTIHGALEVDCGYRRISQSGSGRFVMVVIISPQ